MIKGFLAATGLMLAINSMAQAKIASYYKTSGAFNGQLQQIVREVGLDSTWDAGEDGMETVSFAVIDFTGNKPLLGGVNMDNFIYPASVYKMYVAMEVLKQVNQGEYSLFAPYVVRSPNDVDRSKEIEYDPRPLLKNNDTVTIDYLLDLMITRSDNSAANCLIDVARRPRINETMHNYGWFGSEVTRKFLKRSVEDPGYDTIRSTVTSALHAADFMYRVATNELVNPWVSMQMKALLGRQLDTTKLSTGLPAGAMFYHKTGWWSIYTNDVGFVDDGNLKYVVCIFTPVREELVRPRLKALSEKLYALMKKRHS